MNSLEIAQKCQEVLDDKKGIDIKLIKADKDNVLADYIVIATGTSSTHVKALADEVEEKIGHPVGGVCPFALNDDVEVYYFLALENGLTKRKIKEKDKECLKWIKYDDVEKTLSYPNLIELWNDVKKDVLEKINE